MAEPMEKQKEDSVKHVGKRKDACFGLAVMVVLLFFWVLVTFTAPTPSSTFEVYNPSKEPIKLDMQFKINITFKVLARKRCDSALEEYPFAVERSAHNLSNTIIVECPPADSLNLNDSEIGYLTDLWELLDVVNNFSYDFDRPSFQVWLQLNPEQEVSNDLFCAELADVGNSIYPGTFVGVIGSSERLFGPTLLDYIRTQGDKKQRFENLRTWEEEYLNRIAQFNTRNQSLQFGAVLNPDSCFFAPTLIPESVLLAFDQLFFIQEDRAYKPIINNLPVCVDRNMYDECNDYFRGKVAEVEPILQLKEQDKMSYKEFFDVFYVTPKATFNEPA